MEVFCLRVDRRAAGKVFPFDRVYLVNYDDRAVIERLFRYALVLPVEDVLRGYLLAVSPEKYTDHTFNRDDAANRADVSTHKEWASLITQGSWLMVVPLLPKWMGHNVPRYLTAATWHDTQAPVAIKKKKKTTERVSPFTSMAYLQTPGRKIRPICVMCPRMILHKNGECEIGEPVCFTSLSLGIDDHFAQSVAPPDATPDVRDVDDMAPDAPHPYNHETTL